MCAGSALIAPRRANSGCDPRRAIATSGSAEIKAGSEVCAGSACSAVGVAALRLKLGAASRLATGLTALTLLGLTIRVQASRLGLPFGALCDLCGGAEAAGPSAPSKEFSIRFSSASSADTPAPSVGSLCETPKSAVRRCKRSLMWPKRPRLLILPRGAPRPSLGAAAECTGLSTSRP